MLPVTLPPANTVPKTAAVAAEREAGTEREIGTAMEKGDTVKDIAIATERATAMATDTGIPAAGDTGMVVMEMAEGMATVGGKAHERPMDGGKAPATGTAAEETVVEKVEKKEALVTARERAPRTATVPGNRRMRAKVEKNQKVKVLQFQIFQNGKRADGTVNFPENVAKGYSICHKRSLLLGRLGGRLVRFIYYPGFATRWEKALP